MVETEDRLHRPSQKKVTDEKMRKFGSDQGNVPYAPDENSSIYPRSPP